MILSRLFIQQIESQELLWNVECSLDCSSFLRSEKKEVCCFEYTFSLVESMTSEVEAYIAVNLSFSLRSVTPRQVEDMMNPLLSNCNPDGRFIIFRNWLRYHSSISCNIFTIN